MGRALYSLKIRSFFSRQWEVSKIFKARYVLIGVPRWCSGKESTCECRRHKRLWFDPWAGKIPWRREWQPTPVILPGESHEQRSLVGYSPWSHRESDTTEHAFVHARFHTHTHTHTHTCWSDFCLTEISQHDEGRIEHRESVNTGDIWRCWEEDWYLLRICNVPAIVLDSWHVSTVTDYCRCMG